MGRLDNKVAIVTGAASGMGKEISKLFASEGAKVVASDINEDGARAVVDEIIANGGTAFAIQTDVSSEEAVNTLIDRTVEEYGTLDILINNAGIMDNVDPVDDVTNETWRRVFAVNVDSVMFTIRKAMPIFLEKKYGVIVNLASVGGLFGGRAGVAYTAAKHAVVGITKNVGFFHVLDGVRCNAIAPGAVETNIGASMRSPNMSGLARQAIGLDVSPRLGKASEIASAALFLASDESSFVNGTVLTVDAGWSAY